MWRVRFLAAVVSVAAVALLSAQVLSAAEESASPTAKGTVVKACPQGKQITIKTESGEEVTYPVLKQAQETVKGLKAGDNVHLTLFVCPKTHKTWVKAVVKVT